MFVRFRQNRRRLQYSLIETRRADGKLRYEHIARLRAVPIQPSIADRITFWGVLHQRLGKLSNRASQETLGKLIETTADDERLWSTLHDMFASTAADQKELPADTQSANAVGKAAAADAAATAERVKERFAKIDRGENMEAGLRKPPTYEDAERILLAAGFMKRGIRHVEHLANLFDELEHRGIKQAIFLGRVEQAL